MKRVLILCTGNSCRSQMAEGWLRSFGGDLQVDSAGTHPAPSVSRKAIAVMKEEGVDISGHLPKSVDQFTSESFDYVITVCDDANERCPVFTGRVRKRLHMPFEDPSFVVGSEEEILSAFRDTRDRIRSRLEAFHREEITRHG